MIVFGVFIFALGACVGSFLNVVIWRLPNWGREVIYQNVRGRLTLSWPASHCPKCDAPIRWYQNIPVLAWLALRGRCANCRKPIAVRYPLVELGTACLFLGFFLADFVAHWQPGFINPHVDWPAFALQLVMVAALLAASAIDADLFFIPLSIPYFLLILALAATPFIDQPTIFRLSTAAGSWWLTKPVLGAIAGLLVAIALMALHLLPRSFSTEPSSGVESAERDVPTDLPLDSGAVPTATETAEDMLSGPPMLTRFRPSLITASVLVLVGIAVWFIAPGAPASLADVLIGIALFLLGVLPRDADQVDVTDEVMDEISAPHVRREVAKELVFLAFPIAGAVIAYFLPWQLPEQAWLGRLLGALLGALSGGAIVWFVRVGGTFAFNKEAMGMGDAHLLLGIGAILGAPLVIVAFFIAPFIGLMWAIVLLLMKKPNVLPYGPWLSVGAILSLLVGYPLLRILLG